VRVAREQRAARALESVGSRDRVACDPDIDTAILEAGRRRVTSLVFHVSVSPLAQNGHR
jgi:hypothetical protein